MQMQKQEMGISSIAKLLGVCVVAVLVGSCNGRSPTPRKQVTVEGSVECFYCVVEGGPGSVQKTAFLPGAVVKLQCNNTKRGWEEKTTTDSEGRFVFRPTKVSTWGAHMCKVSLVSSPRKDCPLIDSLNHGDTGDTLKPAATNTTSSTQLYTVGPFLFYPDYYGCL